MFTHRKYFCGEGAQRTEAQAKTQRKGIAPCECWPSELSVVTRLVVVRLKWEMVRVDVKLGGKCP